MLFRLTLLALSVAAAASGADDTSSPPPSSPSARVETLAVIQSEFDAILSAVCGAMAEPPTVVLAGDRNNGKTSLLNALIQCPLMPVGTSSMTRRPIYVHAQHDPSLDEPRCFLTRDPDASEECSSIKDVRAYIEAENARLAQTNDVDTTPIRIRLRWRLAPNLVLVDTPGLLSLPADFAVAEDAQLARTSAKVEQCLLSELNKSPNRLCLCLEDTADWQLCPTSAVVRRADPQLSRTILVATKLDGKLQMFSSPEDLHRLLNPAATLKQHAPKLLGGPIFTCIPPVRGDVTSPGALAEAIAREEAHHRNLLSEKLGSDEYASCIGVHALRAELQPHIDQRWAELLGSQMQSTDARLASLQKALAAPPEHLDGEDLHDFAHRFCRAVASALDGTPSSAIPLAEHGETLQQEQERSGSGPFCDVRKPESAAERKAASDLLTESVGQKGMTAALEAAADAAEAAGDAYGGVEAALWTVAAYRLLGGAQYHRAMEEFMLCASQAHVDEVSCEEIVNAMGVDGYHDGVNYMHAACVIVVEKARGFFDEALEKLRLRMLHIMNRLGAQAEALMLTEASRYYSDDLLEGAAAAASSAAASRRAARSGASLRTSELGDVRPVTAEKHAEYMQVIAPVFQSFVQRAMESTMERCMHDVACMTRYVSWDFGSPTKDAVYNIHLDRIHQALATHMVAGAAARQEAERRAPRRGWRGGRGRQQQQQQQQQQEDEGSIGSVDELIREFTTTVTTRRVSPSMSLLLNNLVKDIIRDWRDEFCRTIKVKFNAGFLLPFCESLPNYMRREAGKYARELGVDADGGHGGGPDGAAVGVGDADPRLSRVRASMEEAVKEREVLQRLASSMHSRQVPGVPLKTK